MLASVLLMVIIANESTEIGTQSKLFIFAHMRGFVPNFCHDSVHTTDLSVTFEIKFPFADTTNSDPAALAAARPLKGTRIMLIRPVTVNQWLCTDKPQEWPQR